MKTLRTVFGIIGIIVVLFGCITGGYFIRQAVEIAQGQVETPDTSTETPGTDVPDGTESEVVQYLKEQLKKQEELLQSTQKQLDNNIEQLEQANKNNQNLTQQNQELNSSIQSLQETVKSLNAEIQRLTALLEEYGKIAEGTWEVHFYNGEDLVSLLLVKNNSKITETVSAKKEGFEFKGWALESDKNAVIDYQNIEITEQMNFYAVFERISGLFNSQKDKIKTWDELIGQGDITVEGNKIKKVNSEINGYLIVPDSFTVILDSAFSHCDKLTGIDCYGVTSIESNAFEFCHKLREIHYGDTIYFGRNAFRECDNIKSIVLPENTQISVFGDVFFPGNGLIEIINNSNLSNSEIKQNFYLDSHVVDDYEGIHSGESRIKSIDGVNYYIYKDWYIAVGASDYRENIKLVDECNVVFDKAFRYQDQLKNVALNEKLAEHEDYVDSLGGSSFSHCAGLETVWVPFELISRRDYSSINVVFACSNTSALTIYIDKDNFSQFKPSDLFDFLEDVSYIEGTSSKIEHYQLGCSRSDYLQKFKF